MTKTTTTKTHHQRVEMLGKMSSVSTLHFFTLITNYKLKTKQRRQQPRRSNQLTSDCLNMDALKETKLGQLISDLPFRRVESNTPVYILKGSGEGKKSLSRVMTFGEYVYNPCLERLRNYCCICVPAVGTD